MPDPCRSMRESKRKKEDDIRLLKKKLNDSTVSGEVNKSVQEDIYTAEQAIKQLRIDIKACMKKNKKTKSTESKATEKPGVGAVKKTSQTSESLDTSYNEPSHGTGTRKQIS